MITKARQKPTRAILLLLLWLVATALPLAPVRAQTDALTWVQAVNISSAPATTDPIIVAGPEGMAQAFWWDTSDGLVTAVYDGSQWLAAQPAPILISLPSGEQADLQPVAEMPTIVEDSLGWVHALWLGGEEAETGLRPLMHSRLAFGSTTWDTPNRVTDSASAWKMVSTTGGALYLVFFRPAEMPHLPAGLYHQRSFDGGLNWTDPVALAVSPDYASTLQSTSFLDIAAGVEGSIFVTWDDPQSKRAMYTMSADGGRGWKEPQLVDASPLNARRARIILGSEQEILFLWEATRSELAIGLYQQFSQDGGQTWREPEPIMQNWLTSIQGMDLVPLGDGKTWMVIGGQTGALELAIWDRERAVQSGMSGWSDVQPIELRPADQAARAIDVRSWRPVLRDGIVTVVGRASDSSVWALRIPVDQVEATYAPVAATPQETAMPPGLQNGWEEPVNLSRSGSAFQPVLITGEEGVRQAFWWDQFDGLMSAYYDGETWSPATASPILISTVVERIPEEPEIVRIPVTQMPQIIGDQGGRAHAFWLMQPPRDPDEGESQPVQYLLMHSMLTLGQTTWSEPRSVAESALTWQPFSDPTGRLHLLYVRPTHTARAPAGVYYTSLAPNTASWPAPQVLYPSIYARLFAADQIHMTGAADVVGNIVVAWNDPRLEATFMARSGDAGASWEAPAQVSIPDVTLPKVAAVGEAEFLMLWQTSRAGYSTALYAQHSRDGGVTWDAPQRVLEDLTASTQDITFQVSSEGDLILIAGMGSPSLTLAVWGGSPARSGGAPEWSEPQVLDISVQDPETHKTVWLDALQIAVSQEQFAVIGWGQDGEIWSLQRANAGFDWFFAPPPPWSGPTRVSLGQAYPNLPTIATDMEGQVHVLWGESSEEGLPPTALTYIRWDGTRWIQPVQVLRSPDGPALQPCLVAAGEYLHAVWSGGQNGQIYYSWAFVRDGGTPGGWSDPLALPGPAQAEGVGSAPHLVADLGGNLHLVYAVPLNEGRGIYYLRSDDGGESWSAPQRIFDASAAGWGSADRPVVAVDVDGTIYVVWVRASLASTAVQGIYFARSTDGGQTWSEAFPIAEGDSDQPQIAIARGGKVHVLWREVAGSGRWSHRWSVDRGRTWSPATQVRGFSNLQGRPALVYDRVGGLYLIGIGLDEVGEPELRFTTWDNDSHQWVGLEYFRVGREVNDSTDIVSTLLAPRGQLHAVLRGVVPDGESAEQVILLYTRRSVPAVEQMPMLIVTPGPMPMVTPVPGQTPTLAPTPTVNPAPPPSSQEVGFGPLSLPLLGAGGVLVAGVLVAGTLFLTALKTRGGRYDRRRS